MTGSVSSGAVTWLFVPGSAPARFAKARASGADLVILDLEDAVAPEDKDVARAAVADELDTPGDVAVRINAPGTEWFDEDLRTLSRSNATVVVPKAESPAQLREIASAVPSGDVVALVETATGLRNAWELAEVEGIARLALGHLDLAAQLGVDPDNRAALLWARSTLVTASAAADIGGPVDGVTTAVLDDVRTADDAAYAAGLGFAGKLVIHPRQIAPARTAFRPTEEAVTWARRVLTAIDQAVAQVDGAMVDAPVIARARSILTSAGELS